jgi:hypothetical protein
MTGARTVIDILRAAELITELDGKYVADQTQSAVSEFISVAEIQSAPTAKSTTRWPTGTVVASAVPKVQSGLVITIQININCTAAEVPNLGQHIKKLMEELSSPSPDAETQEQRGE